MENPNDIKNKQAAENSPTVGKSDNEFTRIIRKIFQRRSVLNVMHIIILILSGYLVLCISIDTFKNLAFYRQPQFIKVQLWICIFFLLDFFIEWIIAEKKMSYLRSHLLFLIVSIPYQYIIYYFKIPMDPYITYLVGYIPLIRGGYAMAIVIGWFANNRALNLVISYLFTLVATVYFASLVFYLFEHGVNKLVTDYTDALWWATMDVTTVGCNIVAVTTVGRVLSVLLAALGMMMFPIFTVYITSIIRTHNNAAATAAVKQATLAPLPQRPDNKKESPQENSTD